MRVEHSNAGSSPDTIAAISTAPGRSAIGIVRLSGPRVPEIAERLLTRPPKRAREATLAIARDPTDGSELDHLIAIVYQAPHSYTGEPMLELSCHGGMATVSAVLRACLTLGARLARPGEFSQRALLNGKMDLAQAEALPDLIDATSEPMRRLALGVVGGGLSRHVLALRDQVLELEAVMAYSVDFPEEDDGEVPKARVLNLARAVLDRIQALLETAARGALVRDGALVVFAGPPNAGKSSLFNALLGHERAIVTDVPGTTRDAIEHASLIDGWPARLVDTAGLRHSDDIVERLGIEVSERYVKDADVAVVCSDTASGESLELLSEVVSSLGAAAVVPVRTKADLQVVRRPNDTALAVSALTGEGLSDLRRAIAAALEARYGAIDYESPTVTQARHRVLLEHAHDEMRLFVEATEQGVTPTIAAVHLRSAVGQLEEIVGAVTIEDVLDQVFSRFCIGK
jgi:tRNA modification GTPase